MPDTPTTVYALEVSIPAAAEDDLAAVAFLDTSPHRALPDVDGTAGLGGLHDRPKAVNGVCSYHRFAHIDGRIPADPAQYVRRRPEVPETQGHGMDRTELGTFCSPPNGTTRCTLPLPSSSASTACGCPKRAVRPSRTSPSNAATRRWRSWAKVTGVPILCRKDGQHLDRRTAHRWVASIGRRADWVRCIRTCCGPGSSWPPSTPLRDVQLAARRADPRTTTI
jgi:integrase/recombinase XerD